ncbi:MAG: glycosyltransferase family 2 protein [Firmicutes bacterium]|jgi:glycosyltransferase involved in cell wall biosynthesis|nr:glycosyltransferase family 2 protein [Bacillota bacterium]MDD4336928.1 glycosyltransferase family 2 protein [Bacillota bacterium]MDD4791809.1 glycosyltransferase family 2 protein [Bacillota bacterium]
MRVAAIVPAYNEEPRIASVLDVVRASPLVDEIIVVDDGSDDDTSEVARVHGAKVIRLGENTGKGGAVAKGLEATLGDVILFLDADLIGLTVEHVNALIEPVCHGEADMTIGIFGNGRAATDLAQALTPWLSGQRAIRRDALEGLELDIARFGVEAVLTRHARELDLKVVDVKLPGLTHVMKEEKMGTMRGMASRARMYWEVLKSVVDWD